MVLSLQAFADELNVEVKGEITELFDFIRSSPCRFNRNGRWYTSIEAAEHINTKYQYVLKKGRIGSTEDFIKYAAARSSITGREYKVQCDGGELISSTDWLTAKLQHIREKKE